MASFTQRTEAPSSSNAYYYADNPFYASGYGLPNCTCYAWGRFWECGGGSRPTLGLGNAEDWWGYSDGYSRGTTPRLGAVLCWRKGVAGNNADGAGHVEIVEQINEDGSIITSGSAWNGFMFRRKTRTNASGNWDGGDYIFQGFIYNPVVFDGDGGGETIKPEPVTGAVNRYLTRDEMHQNAAYVYWYLSQRGWTANAIAGMLGNMEVESSINPFIWQKLDEGNFDGGFGLVQWTPATKLTNWCSNNGYAYWEMDSQLERLIWEQENENDQFYSADTQYAGMSFTDFKNSELSPYELGMIFLVCYERPANPNQPARGENAEYWYKYITGLSFDGEEEDKRKGLPLWLMYVASRRRM